MYKPQVLYWSGNRMLRMSHDVMLPMIFNMTTVLTILELLPPSNRSAYDICNLTLMFRKHLIEEACLLSIVVVMTIDSVDDKKQHPIWLLAIFIIWYYYRPVMWTNISFLLTWKGIAVADLNNISWLVLTKIPQNNPSREINTKVFLLLLFRNTGTWNNAYVTHLQITHGIKL